MKKIFTLLAIGIFIFSCKNDKNSDVEDPDPVTAQNAEQQTETRADSIDLKIDPISHATAVFTWDNTVFYTDPVGGAESFSDKPDPDFILITDIHGDHMNAETLQGLELNDSIKIIVPKAVQEKLPAELHSKLIVMNNGESINHKGFNITAIPMYNLPQSKDAMHVKGRGNGYVLEKNSKKLYISGDTEDIPEMRNLDGIDVALVSMNLPYTMPVEQAAEGVLAFQPRKIIPYHYRGKDGYADVEKFKSLVNEGNDEIEVALMDWYPGSSN